MAIYRFCLSVAILTFCVNSVGLAAPATDAATTLCVNQGGTGGCFSSISAAVAAAAPGDTIAIAGAPNPYFERLTISESLTLRGNSAANTIIDGAQAGRVISITAGVTVAISNLTIRHGKTADAGFSEPGAGLYVYTSTVTLDNTIVSGNTTGGGTFGGNGAGIYHAGGALTLNNSMVTGNQTDAGSFSSGDGAGIYNAGGTLILNNSLVRGNQTGDAGFSGEGAGIYNTGGTMTITRSTISANITGSGGMLGNSGRGAGIFNLFGNLTVDTSTISGNITGRGLGSADSRNGTGGGLFNQTYPTETVNLLNDTIAFNEIDVNQKGAGIDNLAGTVTLKNTIVAHNYTAATFFSVHDCSGTINLQGYNMIFLPDPTCIYIKSTGDQDYIDPLLRPLQFNGGPTPTHALPANSPAVDAGDNNTCRSTDQRSFHRPVNGGKSLRCDIGAYEFYPFALFFSLLLRGS